MPNARDNGPTCAQAGSPVRTLADELVGAEAIYDAVHRVHALGAAVRSMALNAREADADAAALDEKLCALEELGGLAEREAVAVTAEATDALLAARRRVTSSASRGPDSGAQDAGVSAIAARAPGSAEPDDEDPDAVLIAACRAYELVATWTRHEMARLQPQSREDEEAQDKLLEPLEDACRELADVFQNMRATTLAGARARARAVMANRPECLYGDDPDVLLVTGLLRDLAAAVDAPR